MQGGGPLSPDEHRATSPPGIMHHQPAMTIVVAVDRDRNSQLAVKWVVDHLLTGASNIILLHIAVHPPAANHGFAMAEATHGALEAEMREIFVPFRGFCTRNGVHVSELVLEEADVSKALIEFITVNKILSIALGASNRNAFTKKFKNADVPSSLMKGAPDYCNIYVVAKGKSVNVRLAKCGVDGGCGGGGGYEGDSSIRSLYTRRCSRGKLPPATPSPDEAVRVERVLRGRPRLRPELALLLHGLLRQPRHVVALRQPTGEQLASLRRAFLDHFDCDAIAATPLLTWVCVQPQREVEVEMRRLRLELKQTMDMYNAACREAINAKQRTKELQLLKLEEARRLEEARHAEEAALAMAEMEKTKCRAAMEAAEAAQQLADLEAQRRRNAERPTRRFALWSV
uniref:RING-type E3 ubiquitin transferase n=1 Tax=Oryza barthii TaxID=65489 RepID=A0A0D3EQI3_9ORYZ